MNQLKLLTFIFLVSVCTLHAQDGLSLAWSNVIGANSSSQSISSQIVDNDGNLIIVGNYTNTADFNSGTGDSILTESALGGIGFIAKYAANGQFMWVRELKSSIGSEIRDVVVDNQNNIYAVGYWQNDIDIDLGSGVNTITSNSENGIFIALSPTGSTIHIHNPVNGTVNSDYSSYSSVRIAPDNSFYIFGSYNGIVTFDGPSNIQLNNVTESTPTRNFILKINPTFTMNSVVGTYYDGSDFIVNSSGNIIYAGSLANSGVVDIDPGVGVQTFTPPANSNSNDLIVELDDAMNYLNHEVLSSTIDGFLSISNIELEPNTNNYIIYGEFQDSVDLDFGIAENYIIPTSYSAIFVSKYSINNELLWYHVLNDLPTTTSLFSQDLHVDNDGNVYSGSRLGGDMVYIDSSNNINVSSSSSSALIFKWNRDGKYLWNRLIENVDVRSLKTSENTTQLFIANQLNGTTNADPNNFFTVTPYPSSTNILSIKWNQCSIDSSVSNINGVFTSNESSSYSTFQWYDCSTNTPMIGETNESFTPTYNGSFQVQITKGDCSELSTCVSINNVEIAENSLQSSNLYPNPAISEVTLDLSQTATISIQNSLGQLIFTKANCNGKEIINLTQMPSGIYFVLVDGGDNLKRIQLVKK